MFMTLLFAPFFITFFFLAFRKLKYNNDRVIGRILLVTISTIVDKKASVDDDLYFLKVGEGELSQNIFEFPKI